jgi:hypothetical protein
MMNTEMTHIQSLLDLYRRQQVQSRFLRNKPRYKEKYPKAESINEDRVFISAEAKRVSVNQEISRNVLKRLMDETKLEQFSLDQKNK